MRSLIVAIVATTALGACAPTPETLHRRRVAETIGACVDLARAAAFTPSTFRAEPMSSRVIGGPGIDELAVRVPISARNSFNATVSGEALCHQPHPAAPVVLAGLL